MLLFRNEYPANTSNRGYESLLDAAAGFGANDACRLYGIVVVPDAGAAAGASEPTAGTVTVVVPVLVCALAGMTERARNATSTSDVIVPNLFMFKSLLGLI